MKEKDTISGQRLWAAIPGADKAAFFACVIAGLLTHLFAFTNIIPNADGLSRVFDPQQMTISGRWFLHYASMLHGYVQAPMLIGTLSVLFFALSAALIADVLGLRSRLAGGLCGCFAVVFPAVTYTYTFMFTASAYAFGVLLAVLAVWLCRRYAKGWLPGALILACAVGTYQAYFAVAAALGLCCVILDLLTEKGDLKAILNRAIRLFGLLALGAVLYYGILQAFLSVKDLTLLSYKGMDSFGSGLSIGWIIQTVLRTYKGFVKLLAMPGAFGYLTLPMAVFQILLGLLGAAALLELAEKSGLRRQIGRLVLLVAAILLIPMAFNFSQLLSSLTQPMCYSMVFACILPLALIDRAEGKGGRYLKRAVCLVGALLILLSAQTAGRVYTTAATAHRATQTFATNLVSRVESLPGYQQGMEVVIIGAFPKSVYYNGVDGLIATEDWNLNPTTSVMQLNKHVYYYLNDWLNVPWAEPEEATMQAVSDSAAFQAMPLYPSDGSVAIQDGRVIVRLAESYTPKKDYEIAYENRR